MPNDYKTTTATIKRMEIKHTKTKKETTTIYNGSAKFIKYALRK